jgi:hypothetical protein
MASSTTSGLNKLIMPSSTVPENNDIETGGNQSLSENYNDRVMGRTSMSSMLPHIKSNFPLLNFQIIHLTQTMGLSMPTRMWLQLVGGRRIGKTKKLMKKTIQGMRPLKTDRNKISILLRITKSAHIIKLWKKILFHQKKLDMNQTSKIFHH